MSWEWQHNSKAAHSQIMITDNAKHVALKTSQCLNVRVNVCARFLITFFSERHVHALPYVVHVRASVVFRIFPSLWNAKREASRCLRVSGAGSLGPASAGTGAAAGGGRRRQVAPGPRRPLGCSKAAGMGLRAALRFGPSAELPGLVIGAAALRTPHARLRCRPSGQPGSFAGAAEWGHGAGGWEHLVRGSCRAGLRAAFAEFRHCRAAVVSVMSNIFAFVISLFQMVSTFACVWVISFKGNTHLPKMSFSCPPVLQMSPGEQ